VRVRVRAKVRVRVRPELTADHRPAYALLLRDAAEGVQVAHLVRVRVRR